MKLNSLKDLLIAELSALYHAESRRIDELPPSAVSEIERARERRNRLQQVFETIGTAPESGDAARGNASYGTVRSFAQRLGYGDVADLLRDSDDEDENEDEPTYGDIEGIGA